MEKIKDREYLFAEPYGELAILLEELPGKLKAGSKPLLSVKLSSGKIVKVSTDSLFFVPVLGEEKKYAV